MNKALFLDRDGVINVDVGYAHLPEQITFVAGIFDVCRTAVVQGYQLIIVTNQSGIGRGYYSEEQFHVLMQWMSKEFEKEGCPLTAYYHCPHTPDDGCECRKPKAGMILQAAKDHALNLSASMLIGDKESDIEAGKTAGVGECRLVG